MSASSPKYWPGPSLASSSPLRVTVASPSSMMKKPTPPDPSATTVEPASKTRSLNDDASDCSSRWSRSANIGTCWICSTVAGMARILTGFRGGSFDALRELLDLALGRVQLPTAEAVQLLAALPERDRVVQTRVPALEPLDDLLQLSLRRLEGRLVAHRVSLTVPRKPPSVSSTSTWSPAASALDDRTIPSPARTIA